MDNRNELLIFMHIPKTAGTTLNEIIQKQYKANEICNIKKFLKPDHTKADPYYLPEYIHNLDKLPNKQKNQITYIKGHCWFGVHSYFEERTPIYLTILRDPVERIISMYYYIKQNPGLLDEVKKMSFEEFVHLKEFKIRTSNLQTRMVTGQHPPCIDRAKENIIRYFPVVGIVELFDESIFVMQNLLKWKETLYQIKNKTKKRLSQKELPNEILHVVRRNNQMDIELYEWGKERLLNQLKLLERSK